MRAVTKCNLTADDRRRGAERAAAALGPAGRSIRARLAAEARWGKLKPVKRVVSRPPTGWLLEALAGLMDEYEGKPGYPLMRGRLAELIEWVKSARGVE